MKKTSENWEHRSRKMIFSLATWTGAWLITMAIASFGPKFIWDNDPSLSLIAIIINLAAGIGVIFANKAHLNSLDELQRKIQLEAMGLALGVAVIFGLSYSLLDVTNLVEYDAEISHLVILIGLTYFAATLIGSLRYR